MRDAAHPRGQRNAAGPGQLADNWMLLVVLLHNERQPPAGQVRYGPATWRFANRVELLVAIDAAYRRAVDEKQIERRS